MEDKDLFIDTSVVVLAGCCVNYKSSQISADLSCIAHTFLTAVHVLYIIILSFSSYSVMVCASVGVFMLQYQPLLSPSGGKTAISYLPLTLLLLASLFYLLQPEFIPMEVRR